MLPEHANIQFVCKTIAKILNVHNFNGFTDPEEWLKGYYLELVGIDVRYDGHLSVLTSDHDRT